MEITKRNGMAEPYNKEKVAIAIRKSFASTGQSVTDETILTLVNEVENFILSDTGNRHVERIWNSAPDGTWLLCRSQKLYPLSLATDRTKKSPRPQ